ncbi:MAG TPA: acetylornithine transaminase [Clostridiales bacterium]|nr:acetylornithine transaminase [Clostridiales bacterium]HPV02302.1 acetylornithine transaminase [Clostridiales bacterium]
MDLKEIMEMDSRYYMNTFGQRTPVCFEYGQGICLYSSDGRKYYDFLGGIAVNALGHAHPALVEAVCSQARKLIHCSSLYYIESQARLAKMLAEVSCADRVFFCNSGAEANEGAMKLARIYFKKKGMPEKYGIITLRDSFHGRTLATVAATGQEKYQKPYEPLMPGFRHVQINDIEALKAAIDDTTCAVMMELVQGESGVHPLDRDYVQAVRRLCEEKGLLLIIDEIQTGMGRTGKLFAYEHYGVEPDIFTLAKALAGGVPIGALCAKESVARAFEPGDHGSTFGGNPLACSAGLAVLRTMLDEKLPENAEKMGSYFMGELKRLSETHGIISGVRGLGLMIGIQLAQDKAVEVKNRLFGRGFLVGSVGTSVIRLLPPLIINKDDIDIFVRALGDVLASL